MAEFVPPTAEELNSYFPHYEISDFIAKGGMGAVYKARQTSLDRPVAIKILPPELGNNKAYLASFESEAKSLAKLNHSNLVGIYDFGVIHDMYYIIMEYIPGRSLYYAAHGYSVDEQEAAFLISEICKGLTHAHEHGILHRDIKPANILIDDEARPMLVDFGLAKPVKDQNHQGVTFGTPGYTAPEVIHNPSQVDQRSDIYSVGVMLYELLTSMLPGDPFIPASQKTSTDPRFDLIIQKATNPLVTLRYSSCNEMARELDELILNWDHPPSRGTKILETAANSDPGTSTPLLTAAPGTAAGARANANALAKQTVATNFRTSQLKASGIHKPSNSTIQPSSLQKKPIGRGGGLVTISLILLCFIAGGILILNLNKSDQQASTPNRPTAKEQIREEKPKKQKKEKKRIQRKQQADTSDAPIQSPVSPSIEPSADAQASISETPTGIEEPKAIPKKETRLQNGPEAISFDVQKYLRRGRLAVNRAMAAKRRLLDENLLRNISKLGRTAEEKAKRLPRRPRTEALEVIQDVIQILRRKRNLPDTPPSDANVFILEPYPAALAEQQKAMQEYEDSLSSFHKKYLTGIKNKIIELKTTENFVEIKELNRELEQRKDLESFRQIIF